MEEIFKKYPLLKDQNVPRETLIEFELFISMLQQGNDKINIISEETAKNEVKAKFKQIKPKTMGQALRIDGITPAAVYILLSHVKRKSIKLIA